MSTKKPHHTDPRPRSRAGKPTLRIAAEVADILPAAQLAQFEADFDDTANSCCVCRASIYEAAPELVVFAEGPLTLACLAHEGCLDSGVYPAAGLGLGVERAVECAGGGIEIAAHLGLRRAEPRPLLLLEPIVAFAIAGHDPVERYAELLGLSPVSGPVEQLSPPSTDAFSLGPCTDGLALRHPIATDSIAAGPRALRPWWRAAAGEAVVVVAHGLGLRRGEPTIEEALRLRSAWAATVSLERPPALRRLLWPASSRWSSAAPFGVPPWRPDL